MDCVACHLRLGRLSLQHPAQMEVVGYCYDDYHHNDHNDNNDDVTIMMITMIELFPSPIPAGQNNVVG